MGEEILTLCNLTHLRPMEALQAIPVGSVEPQLIHLDNALDLHYKPGLYRQCEAFLGLDSEQKEYLCSLQDQLNAFPIYNRMAGYPL